MRHLEPRIWLIGGIGTLLLLMNVLALGGDASTPARAEGAGEVTPTYVSELAPAVAISPEDHPVALPSTGAEQPSYSAWPRVAGVAIAALGCVFIYLALSGRTRPSS